MNRGTGQPRGPQVPSAPAALPNPRPWPKPGVKGIASTDHTESPDPPPVHGGEEILSQSEQILSQSEQIPSLSEQIPSQPEHILSLSEQVP